MNQVISLSSFRKMKESKLKSTFQYERSLEERMEAIQSSINRINKLMAELQSSEAGNEENNKSSHLSIVR